MAPVYGMHPLGDPMAPFAEANAVPTAQPYGGVPQAQAYVQPNYGGGA